MLKELKKPGLKKKEDIMTVSPQIKNINKEIVFFLKKGEIYRTSEKYETLLSTYTCHGNTSNREVRESITKLFKYIMDKKINIQIFIKIIVKYSLI